MQQITALELQESLDSDHPPHLLDVREVHEHEFVSLPDAKLIPLGQVPQRTAEIESWKQERVVVYCHHGIRSQHAIAFLSSVGFTQLENLQGGIDAWATMVDTEMPRY